jgi:hypothetical protein
MIHAHSSNGMSAAGRVNRGGAGSTDVRLPVRYTSIGSVEMMSHSSVSQRHRGTLRHRRHRDLTEAVGLAAGRTTAAGAQHMDRRAARDAAPVVVAELAVYGLAAGDLGAPHMFVWTQIPAAS